MPDPAELNPYPKIQCRLHEMWNEGFRIGQRGDPFPMPAEGPYDNDIAERACLKGHKAGKNHQEHRIE